jgi:hypothetical protein
MTLPVLRLVCIVSRNGASLSAIQSNKICIRVGACHGLDSNLNVIDAQRATGSRLLMISGHLPILRPFQRREAVDLLAIADDLRILP